MNEEKGLVMMIQKSGSRRNAFSVEHSRGQNVWFAIQSNVLEDFIDKDIYHEGTEQKGTMKYLRESYYYRIEYSVANSLAALM